MALQINLHPPEPPKKGSKDFKNWYDKNRVAFNKARSLRFKEDAAYRARQQQYKRARIKPDPANCLTLTQLAERLGVTIWVITEWRKKEYFPEPFAFKGSRWVHQDNVHLLQQLKEHFDTNGRRTSRAQEGALLEIKQWVFENWKEQE